MAQNFSLSMTDAQTAKTGLEALLTGKVTPDEVQGAMAKLSSQPGDEQDFLKSYLGQGKKDPYTFEPPTTSAPLPGIAKSAKPRGQRTDQKNTKEDKLSTTKSIYDSPEEFAGRAESVENLPGIQEQRSGLRDMEDMLKMSMSQPSGGQSDHWVRPLSALADSMNPGSKIMQGLPASESQGQKNQRNLAALDDLQKRKGDLNKAIFDGMVKMKSGSETTQQNQTLMTQLATMMGTMGSGGSQGDPDDRRAFQAHQRNIQALKKDVNIRQNLSNMQRIENGLNNAVGVKELTNESFHELQQAIRSSITKGSGGVDERAATYYASLGMSAKKFLQFLDSKPKSLDKNDPFVKHVLEIGQLELNNIKRQSMSQAKMLLGGNRSIYEDPRYQHYKTDLEDLTGSNESMFTPTIDPKVAERSPPPGAKKPAAGGAQTQANFDGMTNDQIKAWIASQGG